MINRYTLAANPKGSSWLRLFAIALLTVSLTSCTLTDKTRIAEAILSDNPGRELANIAINKSVQYGQSPQAIIADIKALEKIIKAMKKTVKSIWGEKDGAIANNKKYVKYTDGYQSQALVDFELGLIRVETVAQDQPLEHLKQAIITTLLTSENPANSDVFSDKNPDLSGKPYLLNQVLDQDNQPIAYQWRANRFAEYLLSHQLQQRQVQQKNTHFVEITMVKSHLALRKQQYSEFVLAAANQYQIKPDLIYGIIETESSFNPFAVSPSNAYGLMQIVPTTAGKDVYDKILKRPGLPTRQTLFTPKENIDIGTAYLYILQNQYLKGIKDPQSRHFAIISAYNGGAGNVFKTFDSNRNTAVTVINKLTATAVFDKLSRHHPRSESRNYLLKVTQAELRYR